MSPALTIQPCKTRLGQVIAFPASATETASKKEFMGAAATKLVQSVASILEDLILLAIESRTATAFCAIRDEAFPKYFDAMHALSALASIAVPRHNLDRLSDEFFCEMEAECRDRALAAFGAEVRDQMLFTVWTLRKTADACRSIEGLPLSSADRDQDAEFSFEYAKTALWTRFHMDCLLKSIETQRPIYPEVHQILIDGLRGAVNAYAWARRGLDLRMPPNGEPPQHAEAPWDDEDSQLLAEATHDQLTEA